MLIFLVLALIIGFVVLFRKEPRSIWPGVLFTFTFFIVIAAIAIGVSLAFSWLAGPLILVMAVVLMAVLASAPLVLGGFLLVNMFIVWRKEGRSVAALTSGIIGAALFIYTGVFYFSFLSSMMERNLTRVELVFVAAFPTVVYIGLAFVCFITYTIFYEWFFNRFGKRPDAVIVLGAQVRDPDQLTPLLRSRVDHGIKVAQRAIDSGKDTVLVFSGGQGPDEPCAEGEAMARYAISQGVDPSRVIVEDKSTTTEENLTFSAELLRARDGVPQRPWIAVASSDYHAFRGALMMRKAGLDGYATGARTARYFWPSAKVREFIAIVVDHKWSVIAFGILSVLAGLIMSDFSTP
ncbi:YdcF family protein [Corynebacterium hindlerae]|uniref:YdcF family protein n=1 Tax=Corynebacterium hindlerae TaxID=699041 RepID=UPI001AD75B67|nr:YdcF family protein [Corynebacterium hindlerae]QTH59292.1 YdcF family protein [Corynebacterium hindlerae]